MPVKYNGRSSSTYSCEVTLIRTHSSEHVWQGRQRSTLWYRKNRQPFKGIHVFSDQLVTFLVSSYLHCIQERLRQLPRTTTHLFSFVFILSSGIVSNSQNWNDESRRLL